MAQNLLSPIKDINRPDAGTLSVCADCLAYYEARNSQRPGLLSVSIVLQRLIPCNLTELKSAAGAPVASMSLFTRDAHFKAANAVVTQGWKPGMCPSSAASC